MINRSFFNAALFLTLLSPIPYGEVLAAESLELRNLPTTRPSPADEPLGRSDSPVVHPALPVPTARDRALFIPDSPAAASLRACAAGTDHHP